MDIRILPGRSDSLHSLTHVLIWSAGIEIAGSSALAGEYRQHQEKIASAGFVSDTWYALVHTPVPIKEAMKIPEGKEAVDKEWNSLADRKAWLLGTVKPRKKVIEEAKRAKKHVHFGSLMDL